MKIYKLILHLALITTIFCVVYENYIYEKSVVVYLPNYKHEATLRQYEIATGKPDEPSIPEYFHNVPYYGKVLYCIEPYLFLTIPILVFISLIFTSYYLYIDIKKAKFNSTWYGYLVILYFTIFILLFILNNY